jgi:hypothetical protein
MAFIRIRIKAIFQSLSMYCLPNKLNYKICISFVETFEHNKSARTIHRKSKCHLYINIYIDITESKVPCSIIINISHIFYVAVLYLARERDVL